jgi:hypothetical protein
VAEEKPAGKEIIGSTEHVLDVMESAGESTKSLGVHGG